MEVSCVYYCISNDKLITLGNYEARDYRGRTPLHLAADMGKCFVSLLYNQI